MKNLRLALYGILVVIMAASCSSAKKLTYWRDMEVDFNYPAYPKPETILRAGDIVNITVSASESQLAAPFNMNQPVNIEDIIAGETKKESLPKGYLLDEYGYIDFPILGRLKLAGLTLSQVKEEISSRIVQGGFIKEPIVTADIKNFTYTVIGSDTEPGNFIVEGNSINLVQALAQARGVDDANANLKDIRVIRTVDGKRRAYSVNLLSKDFFDSPAFYLQQNDVVYVKHRGARLNPNTTFTINLMSTVMSFGTFAATIFLLVKELENDSQ